jgi:aspartate kinase
MESVVIRGVSIERDQAKITLRGVPDQPGNASQVFLALAASHLNIDMIVQNVGLDGKANISFTLHKNDLIKATATLATVLAGLPGATMSADGGIAKLSAVGIGMRSHSGVAAQMFDALGQAGINIQMITTSEIKISVTVDQDQIEEAARVVHKSFRLNESFITT